MVRTTRTIAALLTGLLATLAFASSAPASKSQQTIFDATNDLLRARSVQARSNVLDQLDSLGVDTVRVVVPWRQIVPAPGAPAPPAGFDPTDPADFTGGEIATLDAVVRGAAARGMRVLLTPSSPIPNWASRSGRSSLADPIPGQYRKLITGLGRRYSGTFGGLLCSEFLASLGICVPQQVLIEPIPRVDFWSFYNEPNLELFLKPQIPPRQAGRRLHLQVAVPRRQAGPGGVRARRRHGPDRRDRSRPGAHRDRPDRVPPRRLLPRLARSAAARPARRSTLPAGRTTPTTRAARRLPPRRASWSPSPRSRR